MSLTTIDYLVILHDTLQVSYSDQQPLCFTNMYQKYDKKFLLDRKWEKWSQRVEVMKLEDKGVEQVHSQGKHF